MIRKRYERIPFVAFFFAFMVAKGRSFGLLGYGERNDRPVKQSQEKFYKDDLQK